MQMRYLDQNDKRDLHTLKETYIRQKRPTYVKRDVHTLKETDIHLKKTTKEAYRQSRHLCRTSGMRSVSKETQKELQKRPTYSFSLIPDMRKQDQMPPRAQRSRRRRKHLSYPRCSVTKYMSKEAYKKIYKTNHKRDSQKKPENATKENAAPQYASPKISFLFAQQCGPICQ